MKKFLILILIVSIFISCKKKNVWTGAYEKQVYNMINDTLSTTLKDSDLRKDLCKYLVSELKNSLPYGIESVPIDSLGDLTGKFTKEYLQNQPHKPFKANIAWSPEVEESLKESINDQINKKVTNKSLRDKYCDCMLAEYKKSNPDSLVMPVADSNVIKFHKACAHIIPM